WAGIAGKFAIDPAANAGTATTARISSLGISSTRLRVRNSPGIFVIPSSIAQVGCVSPRRAISCDGGNNVGFALCETKPPTMQFCYRLKGQRKQSSVRPAALDRPDLEAKTLGLASAIRQLQRALRQRVAKIRKRAVPFAL